MKKIILFCFFIIFYFCFSYFYNIFAEEINNVYIISDFSKGLNNHQNQYILNPGQANELENVRFNEEYGSLSKRQAMELFGDSGSSYLTGLHRYYKSDNSKQLIAASSTYLYFGDDSTGTFTAIKTGLTDGAKWQFLTYKDIVIGTNGNDQPIKYDGKILTTANTDGARTANCLAAQLGAPFAELNTGTTLDASKWYSYKVAFYDDSLYTYSEAKSNPILTGADVHDIYLTDIPLGPSGTTARYIYRTEGLASQSAAETSTDYYYVATISDNSTRVYADSIDDATLLTDRAPTWNTVSAGTAITPPIGKYLEINSERLFIACNPTYQSDIYWSDQFNPDFFDPLDFEQIRPDDGDKITFVKNFLGILIIGKTNSIQKFYTEGSSDTSWQISDPFSFIGCHAPYTAVTTPKGIFYLNKNGIYVFNGQNSICYSDRITKTIKDISQSSIENAWGIYLNNEYQLAYTSTETGAVINDRIIIYDFLRESYSIDSKNVNCFCSLNAGSDNGILYFGSSTTNGYVYSEGSGQPELFKNKKSQIDAGTYDDVRTRNTEDNPIVELAWDCTIDGWLTELQTKDASINTINDIGTYLPNAIIDRPDTDGTWTSEVYQINAGALDKLYWNEHLYGVGNITFNIRLGATTGACTSASWSSAFSDPSGSDISGVSGNVYIQFKINFSTTNINISPDLYLAYGYLFKLTYYKTSSTKESSFSSYWKSGWDNFGNPINNKKIKQIRIYYEGTEGTLNFDLNKLVISNSEIISSDAECSLSIDLSIDPASSSSDEYLGNAINKVYIYNPERDTIGRLWQIEITENGTINWKIKKIEFIYNLEEIYDF